VPPAALADLAEPGPAGPWRVGVLTGSAAESEMRGRAARGAASIEVIGYDGTIDSLEQVRSEVLDAAVLDDCIFTFYADRFAGLRTVDRPFAGGLYTVLTSRRTPRLTAAIDEAIGRLIADGRLKAVYDRWDLASRCSCSATPRRSRKPAAAPSENSCDRRCRCCSRRPA
jgi:ABC-type amino acid transport substrate-binding protein